MTLLLYDEGNKGRIEFNPFKNGYTGNRNDVNEVINQAKDLEMVDGGEPKGLPKNTISPHGAEEYEPATVEYKKTWLEGQLSGLGVITKRSDG